MEEIQEKMLKLVLVIKKTIITRNHLLLNQVGHKSSHNMMYWQDSRERRTYFLVEVEMVHLFGGTFGSAC